MILTFVLILTLANTTTPVPGFDLLTECQTAGQEWKAANPAGSFVCVKQWVKG